LTSARFTAEEGKVKDIQTLRQIRVVVLLGLLGIVSVAIGYAQVGGDFNLSWNTVDGGGGRSTTGGYELTGAIGQPDSTVMTYTNVYTLYGGFFWAGPVATPCPACPTATPTPSPTPCALTFGDVPPDSTFYPYIRCMVCRGIISGYADGTFRPNSHVTRGQLSKIVSNTAGYNDSPQQRIFEDVPEDNPFYLQIQRLANRSVISGYPCGGVNEPCGPENRPYFRWGGEATRGQISKIVASAAGLTGQPSTQTFEDVPPSNTFYVWIEQLAELNVMTGYPCGGPNEPCGPGNRPYFRWGNDATRGQVAKIVANTFLPGCVTPSGP
jgi:hypothetical protein